MSMPGSPWRFIALVLVLSAPFWLLGAVMSGPAPLLPITLPISALMTFAPAVAALLLVWRVDGAGGVRALLRRLIDPPFWRRPLWLLVAVGLMPAALLAEWLWLSIAGAALPEPRIALAAAMAFLPMFLVGAVGEELGWQGYLYPKLAARMPALVASLVIGVFWSAWHIIPLVQVGREPGWIFWQCLAMLPLRVITAWLYASGGRSVALAVVFHAMGNVAQFLFPNYGSHYDPMVTFAILSVVAVGIVLAVGPRTLGDRTGS
jgi:membrane protease YdiL (CAAX protease family)